MSDFPIPQNVSFSEAIGVDTSASNAAVDVTSSTTAATFGSWYELTASTSRAASLMVLAIWAPTTYQEVHYLQIGIGAAASEIPLIDTLMWAGDVDGGNHVWISIPIYIPEGVRLSARGANRSGGITISNCAVYLYSSSFMSAQPFQKTVALGLPSNVPTSVDPGGVANTKGSYAQLESSTSVAVHQIYIMIAIGSSSLSEYSWLVDISIGAASNEIPILENFLYTTGDQGNGLGHQVLSLPITIPAGTRISARAQCNGTDASDRVLQIAIMGLH